MVQDALSRETLTRAAEVLGGRESLAAALGVNQEDLDRWLHGESRPPAKIVFAALNILERQDGGS